MGTITLTNRLRVFRAIENLTQEALAQKAGISRKSVNAIEVGRFIPSTDTALRLAQALNVTVEQIFSLSSQEKDADQDQSVNKRFQAIGHSRPPQLDRGN